MQKIDLNDWQVLHSDSNTYEDVYNSGNWQKQELPLELGGTETLSTARYIWLQTSFDMPPNDTCSQWWLEADMVWASEAILLWLNGQLVTSDDPTMIEMTNHISIGSNILLWCLRYEATVPLYIKTMACVPYPCA